jgi:methionyl-tRNA formyltransferase
MRIIFAGTPEISSTVLQHLLACQKNIIACYTQPDRAKGRGQQLEASPVKILANLHNIPVFQPENFKAPEAIAQLQALKPDVIIVVAYGLILPSKVLTIAPFGCINIHASLLPQWRGASPINQAILAGEQQSGITIMQMDRGMDTGPIIAKYPLALHGNETTASLTHSLALVAQGAIIETLEQLERTQTLKSFAQDNHLATYAAKITKQDALIDWQQSAITIERQIRAYNPWPIAFSFLNNENIKIWQAAVVSNIKNNAAPGVIIEINKQGVYVATGDDILQITCLQFPSKKPLGPQDLFNSKKLQIGAAFNTISS